MKVDLISKFRTEINKSSGKVEKAVDYQKGWNNFSNYQCWMEVSCNLHQTQPQTCKDLLGSAHTPEIRREGEKHENFKVPRNRKSLCY